MNNFGRGFAIFAVLWFGAGTASAQDVAGFWVSTDLAPDGEPATSIRLSEVDGELSGSFRNQFVSARLPIHDGSVNGREVTFKLQLRTRLLQYEGVVESDSLTLSSRIIEGPALEGRPDVVTISLVRSDRVNSPR
jgi:hypothetical protein